MVLYLSNRGKHSGSIGRNLRYKSWFNYIASVKGNALTPRDYNKKTSLEQGKWPRYLCCQFKAGLGDRMFAFASSYGIAKKKHRILVTRGNTFPMFNLRANGSVVERGDFDDICSNVKEHQKTLANRFLKKDLDDPVVVLKGHLHSWKYFQSVEKELRKMFTFRKDIVGEAQKILHEIKEEHLKIQPIPKNITFVGMHVRRSGIGIPLKGFRVAPRSYFLKAMVYFRKKFQRVIFVMVSDSPSWCRRNLPGNVLIISNDSSADLDMAILSQCNHTISSGGTFGWWSAWLAKGMTTYFKPSIKNHPIRKAMADATFAEFFWPGWIPITAKGHASVNVYKKKKKSKRLLNKKAW